MSVKCRFLDVTQYGLACGIGVNFYALRDDCELCADCLVPILDDSTHCKYLEFYVILSKEGGNRTVRVELGCALSKSGLENLLQCQNCSAFEHLVH